MKQELWRQPWALVNIDLYLENSEEIDDKRLMDVAEALGVSLETLKNFSDESVFNYFNNFYDQSSGQVGNHHCTFNPLDKMMELVEENKKLYERLLAAEKELSAHLRSLIK